MIRWSRRRTSPCSSGLTRLSHVSIAGRPSAFAMRPDADAAGAVFFGEALGTDLLAPFLVILAVFTILDLCERRNPPALPLLQGRLADLLGELLEISEPPQQHVALGAVARHQAHQPVPKYSHAEGLLDGHVVDAKQLQVLFC